MERTKLISIAKKLLAGKTITPREAEAVNATGKIEWQDILADASAELRTHPAPAATSAGTVAQEEVLHRCGLPMSTNPHPLAGKPDHYLKHGTTYECIPCLVQSRHSWAEEAATLRAQLEEREAQLESARCHIYDRDRALERANARADRASEKLAASEARVGVLEAYLHERGHVDHCPYYFGPGIKCECGFDAALSQPSKPADQEPTT